MLLGQLDDPVQVMGRTASARPKGGWSVELTIPPVFVTKTGRRLTQTIAAVAAEEIRTLIRGGAFGAVSSATAKRREYRAAQAARGGEPAGNWGSDERRDKARLHLTQRFGGATPTAGSVAGVESGLLVDSIRVASNPGGGYRIMVSPLRGWATGALQRVLARRPGFIRECLHRALAELMKRTSSTFSDGFWSVGSNKGRRGIFGLQAAGVRDLNRSTSAVFTGGKWSF